MRSWCRCWCGRSCLSWTATEVPSTGVPGTQYRSDAPGSWSASREVLNQTEQHALDRRQLTDERFSLARVQVAQRTSHLEVALGFGGGTRCDLEEANRLLSRASSTSFCDVRWDGENRASDLCSDQAAVAPRKTARRTINCDHEVFRPRPHSEPPKIMHEVEGAPLQFGVAHRFGSIRTLHAQRASTHSGSV